MSKKSWMTTFVAVITLIVVVGLLTPALIYAQDDVQIFLGIQYELTEDGALVVLVGQGSPAADAGIEPGDLITAVNGEPVSEDVSLLDLLGLHEPGDEVTLAITRDEEPFDVTVILGNADDADNMRGNGFRMSGEFLSHIPLMSWFGGGLDLETLLAHPVFGELIEVQDDGTLIIPIPDSDAVILIIPNEDGGYIVEMPAEFDDLLPARDRDRIMPFLEDGEFVPQFGRDGMGDMHHGDDNGHHGGSNASDGASGGSTNGRGGRS